ncbi:MAG: dockerin type I repeat-containing protein [Muribaculaceae bacterium]|nr:dockerin type I repeat-containing protein [Muribaculaceae bacterium]
MKKLTWILLLVALTLNATTERKHYVTRVYDFVPAPGQFANKIPYFYAGEPRDSLIKRAADAICGRVVIEEYERMDGTLVTDTTLEICPSMVSLGSYGGYIVFGFDHPVVNVPGEYDFQIFGNAFQADNSSSSGGSCEPGIVMVSEDVNGNGIPDDPWYELAGSEYNHPTTVHGYEITYYMPDENKVKTPNGNFITDTTYIRWMSNDPDPALREGYIDRLSFHTQPYWPLWYEGETMTFTGTKLRNNYVNERKPGDPNDYFVLHFFDWGYVDNRPDYDWTEPLTDSIQSKCNLGFKIDWAVNDAGQPANLRKVDFIKVYSALTQKCGWLGDTSTEVRGGIDIHPDAELPPLTGDVNGDGDVDVADANLLINMVLGSTKANSVADVNGDGSVDVADVNTLINIILN